MGKTVVHKPLLKKKSQSSVLEAKLQCFPSAMFHLVLNSVSSLQPYCPRMMGGACRPPHQTQ